jgi:hypothetical protein
VPDERVFDYATPTTQSFLPARWRRRVAWTLVWIAAILLGMLAIEAVIRLTFRILHL